MTRRSLFESLAAFAGVAICVPLAKSFAGLGSREPTAISPWNGQLYMSPPIPDSVFREITASEWRVINHTIVEFDTGNMWCIRHRLKSGDIVEIPYRFVPRRLS
jgi:hypothetical protein